MNVEIYISEEIAISPYLNGLRVQTLIAQIQTNYRHVYIYITVHDQYARSS